MNHRLSQGSLVLTLLTAFLISVLTVSSVCGQTYIAAPSPLDSVLELTDLQYSYNPNTQTLTKSYTFKNISGQTIENPRLVNLFHWSQTICATVWTAMVYDGTGTFSNSDQSVTVSNNDGSIDWSASVIPASIDSTNLFPALQVQVVQVGIQYPYWNIPGYPLLWPDGQSATVQVEFSNVQNCNWVQNMVWLVYEQGPTLVELSMLQAVPGDKAVTLLWATASEVDNAGFNIYRQEAAGAKPVKLNEALIPAQGSPASGSEYMYLDKGLNNGVTYTYILEDVDINGMVTEHGPVEATPRWIYSIYH